MNAESRRKAKLGNYTHCNVGTKPCTAVISLGCSKAFSALGPGPATAPLLVPLPDPAPFASFPLFSSRGFCWLPYGVVPCERGSARLTPDMAAERAGSIGCEGEVSSWLLVCATLPFQDTAEPARCVQTETG